MTTTQTNRRGGGRGFLSLDTSSLSLSLSLSSPPSSSASTTPRSPSREPMNLTQSRASALRRKTSILRGLLPSPPPPFAVFPSPLKKKTKKHSNKKEKSTCAPLWYPAANPNPAFHCCALSVLGSVSSAAFTHPGSPPPSAAWVVFFPLLPLLYSLSLSLSRSPYSIFPQDRTRCRSQFLSANPTRSQLCLFC